MGRQGHLVPRRAAAAAAVAAGCGDGPTAATPPPTVFPGTFPTGGPSEDAAAIAAFQSRAAFAPGLGFATAFPNFYYAQRGLDHFGGTVLLKAEAVEWRNVLQSDLRLTGLTNFGDAMRQVSRFAADQGFVGGLPAFTRANYGDGDRLAVYLIKPEAAEWRDVPLEELGLSEPQLGDYGARFRATQDYAGRNGFVGGFPNMEVGPQAHLPEEDGRARTGGDGLRDGAAAPGPSAVAGRQALHRPEVGAHFAGTPRA